MDLLLAHLRLANLVEHRLGILLSDITYSATVGAEAKTKALTPIQALTLALMLKHSRKHALQSTPPQSAKEIASRLGCSRTTVQACLVPMLAAKLVATTLDCSDRRLVGYVLSKEGETIAGFAAYKIGLCDGELRRQLRDKKLSPAWTGLSEIWRD